MPFLVSDNYPVGVKEAVRDRFDKRRCDDDLFCIEILRAPDFIGQLCLMLNKICDDRR